MPSKKKPAVKKELTQEEILYSQCIPFVLVGEKKAKRNRDPKRSNPLLDAFQAHLRMGEREVVSRIEAYNTEVADLYDATMAGDERAAALLVEYASVAIQALEQIAHRKPKALHPMSIQNPRWPAFIGNKIFFDEKNHQLMKQLKLGEKSPLNHKWNPKSPATFTAYSMLHWLLENQSLLQLPPLTKATFKEWFECGWNGFTYQLQGHPEKYLYLRECIEKHAPKEPARKQEKRNTETVIKTLMKAALRQGFKTVTKNYPM